MLFKIDLPSDIEFKTIQRFPEYYFGNNGSVWSFRSYYLKQLKLSFTRNKKYYRVGLSINGILKTYTLHSLICEAFHGPKPSNMECCHLDGNGLNCIPTNLKWGTKLENASHKKIHGTYLFGENHGASTITNKLAMEIYILLKTTNLKHIEIAEKLSVSINIVHSISCGSSWSWLKEKYTGNSTAINAKNAQDAYEQYKIAQNCVELPIDSSLTIG